MKHGIAPKIVIGTTSKFIADLLLVFLQSLQKLVYPICQAICFATPKSHFAAPNGVATHSLRSPVLGSSG